LKQQHKAVLADPNQPAIAMDKFSAGCKRKAECDNNKEDAAVINHQPPDPATGAQLLLLHRPAPVLHAREVLACCSIMRMTATLPAAVQEIAGLAAELLAEVLQQQGSSMHLQERL
jgi:hypothetical protein